ncbi:hypothetical protein V8F20_006206 [Naviculisporaceae sp. PSN 640]
MKMVLFKFLFGFLFFLDHQHQINSPTYIPIAFQLVSLYLYSETILSPTPTMAYYAAPPRPDRGSFSYHYPQDTGYGYSTSPNPPYPTNSGYYPPSSTKHSYYPPQSPSSAYPVTAAAPTTSKPRRRSVSFSTPVVTVEPASTPSSSEKKKEMLYRHINTPKSPSSSSRPRRFSKTYDDIDYEYLRTYKDAQVFDDDSQEDDLVYEYNKEKLSRRFDRSKTAGGLSLRRSGTVTEKTSSSSSSSKSPKHAYAEVKMPSLHIPRAPRPPAPQRTSPPPPPAPASNRSGGSDRSRTGRSDRATQGTTVGDYDYEYEYITSSERRRDRAGGGEEKKEKSWMNINGNKIVVDHKGVKINGQRYDAPGGKGTFNVGGIKIRVDGGVISLV